MTTMGQCGSCLSGVLLTHEWELLAGQLGLSARELDVVVGVFECQKDRSIARQLGISHHTVRTHFERLYRKLSVSNRTELVLRVFETYKSNENGRNPRETPQRRQSPAAPSRARPS